MVAWAGSSPSLAFIIEPKTGVAVAIGIEPIIKFKLQLFNSQIGSTLSKSFLGSKSSLSMSVAVHNDTLKRRSLIVVIV